MDLDKSKWIMTATLAIFAVRHPSASVFSAHSDAPPSSEVQIVEGGASQFINANRHEFNDNEELPPHARRTLT
jgi:hypothetical protein